MKMQIVTPDVRIVRFENNDIIVTSPDYDPSSQFDDEGQVCAPTRTSIFE